MHINHLELTRKRNTISINIFPPLKLNFAKPSETFFFDKLFHGQNSKGGNFASSTINQFKVPPKKERGGNNEASLIAIRFYIARKTRAQPE
jgi:hypothetical protein